MRNILIKIWSNPVLVLLCIIACYAILYGVLVIHVKYSYNQCVKNEVERTGATTDSEVEIIDCDCRHSLHYYK